MGSSPIAITSRIGIGWHPELAIAATLFRR